MKQNAEGETRPSWSARCDCRNDHNSSSGRCSVRDWGKGIEDPTRFYGDIMLCEYCRKMCPLGEGERTA